MLTQPIMDQQCHQHRHADVSVETSATYTSARCIIRLRRFVFCIVHHLITFKVSCMGNNCRIYLNYFLHKVVISLLLQAYRKEVQFRGRDQLTLIGWIHNRKLFRLMEQTGRHPITLPVVSRFPFAIMKRHM